MASSMDKLAAAPMSSKLFMLVFLLGFVGFGWWTLYYSELLDKLEKAEKDAILTESRARTVCAQRTHQISRIDRQVALRAEPHARPSARKTGNL